MNLTKENDSLWLGSRNYKDSSILVFAKTQKHRNDTVSTLHPSVKAPQRNKTPSFIRQLPELRCAPFYSPFRTSELMGKGRKFADISPRARARGDKINPTRARASDNLVRSSRSCSAPELKQDWSERNPVCALMRYVRSKREKKEKISLYLPVCLSVWKNR